MTEQDSQPDPQRTWQTLAAAARRAEAEPLAPLNAERVLQAARGVNVRDDRREQRLVSWAAAIAVAASLLITVMSWSDVVAAWSPEPAIFEFPVPLEPME